MDEQQWYVQTGSRIQGPYSTNEIGRYLLLGRIKSTDRVSKDGEWWEPVTQVPELIPEEMLDLDSDQGWQQFLTARAVHDERKSGDTTVALRDRRESAPLPAVDDLREQWRIDTPTDSDVRSSNLLPLSLLAVTLVALITAIYLNSLAGTAV